jgi:hypothetical protein
MKKREKRHEPVFKAIVLVTNQTQCDAAKMVCKRHNLPIWKDKIAFQYVDHGDAYLHYRDTGHGDEDYAFYVDIVDREDLEQSNVVSIKEFEELANELDPQYDSVDDILAKMKEINNQLNK